MPHLLLALSAHGYGHAGQTAPVINLLRQYCPDLRITLRTLLPPAFLQMRFQGPYELVPEAADFGMQMVSAVEVDSERSALAYRQLHADWSKHLHSESARLIALKPDLILANIPYLTLAAAAAVGIPAVAMCSLNWADIYEHYFGQQSEAPAILRDMRAAYNSALTFLQPEPHMPMADLPHRRPIGTIATRGVDRRSELRERLHLADGERLVNISLGGMEFRLPIETWPTFPGLRFIVPRQWGVHRADVIAFDDIGMPFPDVLRASDALITKPGYGSFAEAAVNQTPVLYVARQDWPESPYLVRWLQEHAICAEISRSALERGQIAEPLGALWVTKPRPALEPTGIKAAATYLASLLGTSCDQLPRKY
ncbi:MAG: hypothetical protein HY308_04640 [Gammaproteobacteria bacterium]|nr:hypothetical protein [Gammaproteobacteria bacterium]